jgi:hypothetical protein
MIELVASHAVVLKEKLKMWKAYDIQTDRQTYGQTDAGHFSIRLVQLRIWIYYVPVFKLWVMVNKYTNIYTPQIIEQ